MLQVFAFRSEVLRVARYDFLQTAEQGTLNYRTRKFSVFSLLYLQVIDLCDIPPECGLEWCHLLPHVTFRVLAAGGDGTVGWILNAIDNLKLKVRDRCPCPRGEFSSSAKQKSSRQATLDFFGPFSFVCCVCGRFKWCV